ncbi:AtuA-related protein [Bacillus massilinigeriensis]|uniref:AtuA-related protein n=1 Tax=Bacillus massilionigeriensis TaxID=1805475 RepID=UPI00096AE735|nr:hypothetical protein [Bacillus massilionigeriensis]
MALVKLKEIAHTRSGDKGNSVNVGVFAVNQEIYQILLSKLTAERVKEHLTGLVQGEVIRYELPHIQALNFVCRDALEGGGSATLRLDNLGKCFGSHFLRLEIEIEEQILKEVSLNAL